MEFLSAHACPGKTVSSKLSASLYIHIPFCTKKCLYCDFYSVPAADEEEIKTVLEAEIRQLDFFLRAWRPSAVPTLYLGGGTPSVLPRPLLADFLDRVLERLPGRHEEFTVEANPETLDESFLRVCASRGVTRLSLGLQSFNPRFLDYAGRAASARDNRRALKLLEESWKKDLSLDLMYGFPRQSAAQVLEDLEEALAARPGHVSAYALTLEADSALFQKITAGEALPVNEDSQENLWQALHAALRARGYQNYEVSSYSLPGKRCRHNEAYWKLRPYMGIGPAAASTLPAFSSAPGAASRPIRLYGKRGIATYAAAPGEAEIEELSPRDFLADYLLMGLRTSDGIDEKIFFRIFGFDFHTTFSQLIHRNRRLIDKNQENSGKFTLTDKGRRMLNAILVDFLRVMETLDYNGPLTWPIGGADDGSKDD